MSPPIRLAIIGLGKIAHDQHLPSIAANPAFELVATVSRQSDAVEGRPMFRDVTALAASGLAVDAVAICTPPQVRRAIAMVAIAEVWHVFLEKPPAATVTEAVILRDAAEAAGVSLFAAWHSRYAAGVEPARAWLAERKVLGGVIRWREDVRVWHPGQDWIWRPGGFGVFDPGINALSIATRILPHPFFVESAEFDIPANLAAPIAARMTCRDSAGVSLAMDFDFRQVGPQSWDIVVETDGGVLMLADGGAKLSIDGAAAQVGTPLGEYPGLYARFGELIRVGASDVDISPLRLVADAFLQAKQTMADPFVE